MPEFLRAFLKRICYNTLIVTAIRITFYYAILGDFDEYFSTKSLESMFIELLMGNLLLEGSRYISQRIAYRFDLRTQTWQRIIAEFGCVGVYTFVILLMTSLVPWLIHRPSLVFPTVVAELFKIASYRIIFTFGIITFLFIHALRVGSDLYERWTKSLLEAETLKKENMQAQFDMLRNQINPHFLFNNLNALSSLVYKDPDAAARFVEELSGVYRYLLENKDKSIVPLRSEINFLQAYIFLLKVRFRENLRFTINVPDEYLRLQLPPLTLQMLVENAIKHNIVSRDEPLFIEVFIDENLYLVVRNNLQRRDDSPSTGTGLQNIINRYRYFTTKQVHIADNNISFTARMPLLDL